MYDSRVKTLHATILALALPTTLTLAQSPAPYDPLQTFAPLTLPDPVNVYRSSNGAPGPNYWQNRADYNIHAAIDTTTKTLTATEVITYTNNSPDTLTSLWLNLEQNLYRKDSRGAAFSPSEGRRRRRNTDNATTVTSPTVTSTDGYILDSVEVQPLTAPKPTKAVTVVSDTRLQIQLPDALALKHAAKLRILIHYHNTIPGLFGGRTSWGAAKQGDIYDMAQWYPRMCVYDDLRGWDTLPYLANEFYLEYGHFDYYVTVPSNMIVAGSGDLVNPTEVLTKSELAHLAQARTSDKTTMIRTADEATAASSAHPNTTKTWHFAMDSTRDVSFSASPAFIWDAARMNIPAGAGHPAHPALAQSVYPIESAGDAAWGRSTEYLRDAVEHFSARWYPYPWPVATNVAGFSSGMEYPSILFDGIDDKGAELFWVTAHEIGHTWFPMIVGSNERRDAWIDEGFNTFIDTFESDEFEHGVYGPKRDAEYAPLITLADSVAPAGSPTGSSLAAEVAASTTPADQIAKVVADDAANHGPIILTRADAIKEQYRHPITYFKSAFGLTLLRDDILGPQRFDFAFRKFISDWAFKHPSPSDFFRAMNSSGGEDLSYFWRGWYFNNWQLHMALTSAQPVDKSDPTKGLKVTVANLGQLILPATLRVNLANGSHVDIAIPAETWMQNTTHTFTIDTPTAATSVVLDPNHAIPDIDRTNNTLTLK
jgi:hypothetical protein